MNFQNHEIEINSSELLRLSSSEWLKSTGSHLIYITLTLIIIEIIFPFFIQSLVDRSSIDIDMNNRKKTQKKNLKKDNMKYSFSFISIKLLNFFICLIISFLIQRIFLFVFLKKFEIVDIY